jgi:hypothetical protein
MNIEQEITDIKRMLQQMMPYVIPTGNDEIRAAQQRSSLEGKPFTVSEYLKERSKTRRVK